MHSAQFVLSQAAGIAVLNGACFIAEAAGVLTISAAGYFLTDEVIGRVDRWSNPASEYYVAEPFIVACIAAVICGAIAIIFMLVFDQAADTLLYVYADNKERDPHSVETYAPGTLRDLVESNRS